MVDKLGWDHRYRPLAFGEIIEAGDECRRDDGTWVTGICVGEPAPDPAYTSHRVYRRLKAAPANGEQVERIAAAIGKADAAFGYSFNLTRLVDGEETHTLSMPGFDPVGFADREEGYALIAERRNRMRAETILATLPTPTEDARERIKVFEEALREIAGNNWRDQSRARHVARTALGNKETDRHG